MAAKEYVKLGRGVDYAVDGKYLFLRLDMKAKAEPSSTGKLKLTASTSGFKVIDDTEGFRVTVMGGYQNK